MFGRPDGDPGGGTDDGAEDAAGGGCDGGIGRLPIPRSNSRASVRVLDDGDSNGTGVRSRDGAADRSVKSDDGVAIAVREDGGLDGNTGERLVESFDGDAVAPPHPEGSGSV
jgi:hypothetical protein